jgi:tyrosyl-tRNA synthetase
MPEDLESVEVSLDLVTAQTKSPRGDGHCPVKLDKLLVQAGLAGSASEAGRKIKERAVSLDGRVATELRVALPLQTPISVRLGRKIKRVTITS